MSINKFIEYVIETYGEDGQVIIALEEMAELQKELTKFLRGKSNREHILEELADVQLMLWQLQKIFGFTETEIIENVKRKVKRTLEL